MPHCAPMFLFCCSVLFLHAHVHMWGPIQVQSSYSKNVQKCGRDSVQLSRAHIFAMFLNKVSSPKRFRLRSPLCSTKNGVWITSVKNPKKIHIINNRCSKQKKSQFRRGETHIFNYSKFTAATCVFLWGGCLALLGIINVLAAYGKVIALCTMAVRPKVDLPFSWYGGQ